MIDKQPMLGGQNLSFVTADDVYCNHFQPTCQGPEWLLVADGKVISVLEPPQPSEPRPQISNESPSPNLGMQCACSCELSGRYVGRHARQADPGQGRC